MKYTYFAFQKEESQVSYSSQKSGPSETVAATKNQGIYLSNFLPIVFIYSVETVIKILLCVLCVIIAKSYRIFEYLLCQNMYRNLLITISVKQQRDTSVIFVNVKFITKKSLLYCYSCGYIL